MRFIATCLLVLLMVLTPIESEGVVAITELTPTISGAQAYIVLPEGYDANKTYRVVMAIHGSGREALSYKEYDAATNPAGVAFYVTQRDYALDNDYIFCCISTGTTNVWGTDAGLALQVALYDYMQANYPVREKFVLWATSAGGLNMHRLVKDHADKVDRCMGTFPVYDLGDMYVRNPGCATAWTGSTQEYRDARDPSEWPASLTSKRYLIHHGEDDTTVPPDIHSQALETAVDALGGDVTVIMTSGGHSTSNTAVYTPAITEFLQKVEVLSGGFSLSGTTISVSADMGIRTTGILNVDTLGGSLRFGGTNAARFDLSLNGTDWASTVTVSEGSATVHVGVTPEAADGPLTATLGVPV